MSTTGARPTSEREVPANRSARTAPSQERGASVTVTSGPAQTAVSGTEAKASEKKVSAGVLP
ncbi:hypothetical protein [Streptomyces sp. NPDC001880]